MNLPGWREIPGFELYWASTDGRIMSVYTRRVLQPRGKWNGYQYVNFGTRGEHSVHHLVALTWLGIPPAGYEINHRDGNRINNSLSNLEYVTRARNLADARRRGSKVGRTKLTPEQVRQIRQERGNRAAIGKKFGVTGPCVQKIQEGSTWAWLT